ncbi:unnamed protein product [Aphanomyces euteiches]|uniref:B30.2/SPRY domain-containing protein n=1 Tax=Aphanomyces euteiches TaxID=100861 RepID=A0A6G0XPL0_9STRA|nr:hypothetical protein Ae201684_002677 [Aphanomyces euteiches]KAH9092736.1 hypothetical protein Ae201684P_008405 [Aphanomyces euteiches]KAH9157814.1 hypothetical protein AeRB84_000369 [Aphanomyces euteiches]
MIVSPDIDPEADDRSDETHDPELDDENAVVQELDSLLYRASTEASPAKSFTSSSSSTHDEVPLDEFQTTEPYKESLTTAEPAPTAEAQEEPQRIALLSWRRPVLDDNDENVERVWHRVDMTHKSDTSPSDTEGFRDGTIDDVETIVYELQNECERSQHQVRTLYTRLHNGLPLDAADFLKDQLYALAQQSERLEHHSRSLRRILTLQENSKAEEHTVIPKKRGRPKSEPNRAPKRGKAPPLEEKPLEEVLAEISGEVVEPPIQQRLFWDPERVGQYASVSNNGMTMKTRGPAWNVAMGNITVDCFAVKIGFPKTKYRNAIAIGFIKEPSFWEVQHESSAVFVFNYSGWYMNVRKGSLCSLQGHDDAPFVHPLKHGDILTVILDKTSKTISFLQNDTHLGVAFKDIEDEALFPAIISYDANVEMTFVT